MKHRIKIPIYNQYITIDNTYGDDEEEKAITISDPITIRYCPKYWTINTLAHECVHAVNFICLRCNLVSTYEDDEMYAYLYGHVLRRVYEITKDDLVDSVD